MNLPISYSRRAESEPFDDARVEIYARCRARGVSMQKSYQEAGIAKATAQKIEVHDLYQARLRELKDAAQQFTGMTDGWIMQRLARNADAAHEAGDWKASNQSLSILKDMVKQGRGAGALASAGVRAAKKQRDNFRALLSEPEMLDTIGEESHDGDPA